jgi:DNA polymerase sliding clamp subunit (PCNA homolog)
VIPIGADREVQVDREVLRAALQRAAILSNEKYRGVRVEVTPGQLKISAHNPEQEEAQEEIEAQTQVTDLAIGFNVNYLLDALSALRDEHVVIQLRDSNSSALVREAAGCQVAPRGHAAATLTGSTWNTKSPAWSPGFFLLRRHSLPYVHPRVPSRGANRGTDAQQGIELAWNQVTLGRLHATVRSVQGALITLFPLLPKLLSSG